MYLSSVKFWKAPSGIARSSLLFNNLKKKNAKWQHAERGKFKNEISAETMNLNIFLKEV